MKKAFLIVILTVVAFGILNAETKLKMELWNRWTYQTIDGEVTKNEMALKRGYLRLEPKFGNNIKGRFNVDFFSDDDALDGVGLKLKYAYLDFNNMLPIKDSKLTIGLMKTYFGTIYDWTYQTIDKDPSDKYKFVSSTDYGMGISGYLPNGFGTYALAAYNGEGYKKTAGDINKDLNFVANLRVTPIVGITVGGSYMMKTKNDSEVDDGTGNMSNNPDREEYSMIAGVGKFAFGPASLLAQYLIKDKDKPNVDDYEKVNTTVMSFLPIFKVNNSFDILARYDIYDPNTDTDDDGYNCIYDNIFYTGEEFTVYNASALDVKAENTVWDTDPPIDVSIIDGNDNPAYGIVDYEPTLTPYAPPASFNISVSGNNVYMQGPSGTAYPTLPLWLEGWNLYQNGVLVGYFTSWFIFWPPMPPGTYTFGASYVYEGYHESTTIDTTIYIPNNLYPPTNVVFNPFIGIIFWEPPENSNATLIGYNIYLDDMTSPVATVGIDILEYQYTGLIPGQQYVAGVSAVYEGIGESFIVMDYGSGPYIFNPPTNASYEIIDDHIHLTWQEPEPGSTHPFLNYRIYLDGELFETTELFYDIYDLICGQTYLVGLTALYEYLFESDPIEFEIMFVDADAILISETILFGNYPNPFNPETTISFILTAEDTENAEIEIYNMKGQKIKTFLNHQISQSANQQITWNGTDENNQLVGSGIYFYKLKTRDKTFVRKMLLVK